MSRFITTKTCIVKMVYRQNKTLREREREKKAKHVSNFYSRNHVMSKNALPLERVIIDYIARSRTRNKVVILRDFILEIVIRFLVMLNFQVIRNHGFILHLDAQYLRLSHRKLHLKLRNLVLQVGYGSNAAINWVSDSCVCFINQTAHCICSLMNWKFLKDQRILTQTQRCIKNLKYQKG